MIGISKLYCGQVEPSDVLRYGRHSKQLPSHLLQFCKDKKPIIIWNVTHRCNLKCVHCYANASEKDGKDILSTTQAKKIIDDLVAFETPVILFSGGEPLIRKDLTELAYYTVSKGIRAVLSTNGTLITPQKAKELKSVGLSYIGISLDGSREVHDRFRNVNGSFDKAVRGVENCQAEGIKVGLRFTLNRRNVGEVPRIFDLMQDLQVPRVCFYHLVYSGRGSKLIREALSHVETRAVLDLILNKTRTSFEAGQPREVLTVDNHADGPYIYLRLLRENTTRATEVMELLQFNEGNNSGKGIGCISWDGSVHADQFWRTHTFGNVLIRPFSKIWTDSSIPLLHKLKDKKIHVTGRCAACRYLNICSGNFRARAEAVYGDIWASDPACYLTDEEIQCD